MRAVGVGLDIQRISRVAASEALQTPGVFFTEEECARARSEPGPLRELLFTEAFAAKEALFKALPLQHGLYWTDMELVRPRCAPPCFVFHGRLGALFAERGLSVRLSLSRIDTSVLAAVLVFGAMHDSHDDQYAD